MHAHILDAGFMYFRRFTFGVSEDEKADSAEANQIVVLDWSEDPEHPDGMHGLPFPYNHIIDDVSLV